MHVTPARQQKSRFAFMTIVGPLFWKELIESARRVRYFAVRSLVAAIVLVTLLALGQPLAKNQVSQLAAIGRSLLEKWAWVQLVALVIFVPAFVCGLIAGEKDRKTIDALFTSCLTDREILWGKLASRLYVTIIIITSSIPVIVLLSFLGGFGPKELFDYALIQLATTFFCAALGMYYSVISSKPYVALIRAYFALLVLWVIVPKLGGPIQSILPGVTFWSGGSMKWRFSLGELANQCMMCFDPFIWVGQQNRAPFAVRVTWTPPAYVFVCVATLASAFLFSRSHRLLRTAAYWQRVPRLWRWTTRLYEDLVGFAGRVVERRNDRGIWQRLWSWELKSRSWGSWERRYGLDINPLFYRRATANVYDPERYVAGLQVLTWAIFLGTVLTGGYFLHALLASAENFAVFLSLEIPILALVLVILTSSSIAREAERGSLDFLLLTRLNPRQILTGTIWGVVRTAWPSFALVALTMVLGGVATLHSEALLIWLFTFVPMLTCLIASSLLVTLVAHRTMSAVAASLVPPIFFVTVPSLLERVQLAAGPGVAVVALIATLVVLGLWGRGRRTSVTLAMMLGILIPLVCLLAAYGFQGGWSEPQAFSTRGQYFSYGIRTYGPWSDMNYARWLLGPLFDRYAGNYLSIQAVAAVQFGVAQVAASVWIFGLVLTKLDFMLGRPNPDRQELAEAAAAEARLDAAHRALREGGLPLANQLRRRDSVAE
jgi:ABC-type transport system involved in multi-copper enzyme maturation permease subunit